MLVEMHCHVIYGVDDGARTYEDMVSMLKTAKANGVKHVICTSHIRPGHREFPAERYMRHLEAAREWCAENAPDMMLHRGAEIMFTESTARMLSESSVLTLGDLPVVLVEFMPDTSEKAIESAALQLGSLGYQVIIAHIERYAALRKMRFLDRLRDDCNCLMQMNSHTVYNKEAGFFERRWVKKVLEGGKVDFVSSDAHNNTSRKFSLLKAYRYLEANFGKRMADELCGRNIAELLDLK